MFFRRFVVLKKTVCLCIQEDIYLLLVYLVTALVPSETACLANSPGSKRRTAVWISRDEMVDFLFWRANREASDAILSKISLTKVFRMLMAWAETPTSGWTWFKSL